MDPDDWAKETSPDELSDRISRAIPLMEYIERAAARKYDLSQISGKLSYLSLMGKYLPWITDPAEERMYVQRVAKAAALPEETVLDRLRGKKTAPAPAAPGFPPRASSSRPEEDMLLGLLSRDPSLIEDIRQDGVERLLEGGAARDVVARLGRLSPSDEGSDILSILNEAAGEEARRILSEQMLRVDASPEEARRIYPEVVLGLRIRKARGELVRLRDEIHAAKGDAAQALFTRMLDVRNELEELEKQRRSRR
jgi:DNA primase